MNINLPITEESLRKAFSINTMEEYKQYESRHGELNEFIEKLRDEWYSARKFLYEDWIWVEEDSDSEDDNQYLCRSLVRALFAMIEGITFAYKQHILVDYKAGRCRLSPAEYAVLVEESYQLKDSGVIRTSSNYPNTKANIKFTFPLYARSLDSDFEFDPPLSAPGWQSLCCSIEIRNRLMHPKSLEELEVTDADLEEVERAAEWFTGHIGHLESLWWNMIVQRLSEIQEEDQTTSSDLTQELPDD